MPTAASARISAESCLLHLCYSHVGMLAVTTAVCILTTVTLLQRDEKHNRCCVCNHATVAATDAVA